MKSRLRRSGFTLMEALIAMSLLGVLTLILYRTASVGYRVAHEELEHSAVEARLITAARQMEDDLLRSSPAGMSISADGAVAVIHPFAPQQTMGQLIFDDRFFHWTWSPATKTLVRGELSAPPTGSFDGLPRRWSLAELGALAPGTAQRVLLRLEGVSSFSLSNSPPASYVSPALPVEPPNVGQTLEWKISLDLPLGRMHKTLGAQRTFQLRTSGAP